MSSMKPERTFASATIMKPNQKDVEKAKMMMKQGGDVEQCLQTDLISDATTNVSVVLADRMITSMCERHQKDFPKLCAQLKEVATVMLWSQQASQDKADELRAVFDISPEGIIASASPAINDVVQAKCKQSESEGYDFFTKRHYHMLICITRKSGVIAMYYASVTARRFDIGNFFRSDTTRLKQLAALKVQTQNYLAGKLCSKAPSLAVAEEEPLPALN